jgi:hypothetical protein
LEDIGVYVNDYAIIPLGYDYGCQENKCSGKYRSFNSRESPDVSNIFNGFYDRSHLLNAAWRLVGKRDTYGFGISSKGMMKMNVGGWIPTKGLVCSSNYDAELASKSIINA